MMNDQGAGARPWRRTVQQNNKTHHFKTKGKTVLQSNKAVEIQASHPEQTFTQPTNPRRTITGLLLTAGLLVAQLAHAAFFTPGQFDVTPTGAASYTVPIAVPPGTAGMVPSLALSYNSQGGNGLLGIGWSLSGLSAVTRCPRTIVQDGTKSGINYDANDKYCLDGQRLIAISGSYGANGTEYRTEREGFSKIVSYGSNGYGPTWFKVWTKSGQIMEFGNTTDSQIQAQGKSAIRVWAVNKISDTKSNYLTVTYTEDEPNGQYYPNRIDYTGNANAGLATYNSVRFTYAARPDVIPATYVGGSLTSITQRLANVQTWAKVGGVDTMVKDYQLTYANGSAPNNASRVTQIKECSGAAGDCLSATTLDWQLASGSNGLTASSAWTAYANKTGVGDFNGDGYADVAYEVLTFNPDLSYDYGGYTHQYYVAYSNGNGLGAGSALGPSWGIACGNTACVSGKAVTPGVVGDLNGDGRDDLYGVSASSGASTWMGGSSGLTAGSGWAVYANKTGMGDFNGDGYADVVYEMLTFNPDLSYDYGGYTHQYYVAYSNGSGLGAGSALGSSWGIACGNTACVSGKAVTRGLAGDLNGDGKEDIYGVASNSGAAAWTASSSTPDLLNKVATGLLAETAITYKAISDTTVYTKETTGVYPVRDLNTNVPLYVVYLVSSSNGIGGYYSSYYTYTGGKSHLTGGGFLGFRQTLSIDAQTDIRSTTTYRQDYPYQGLPLTAEKRTSGGTLLNSVTNTWAFDSNAGWSAQYHAPKLTQSVESSYELTGTLISTVTTGNTYDGYGNPTQITVSTGDGYSKTTVNTYTNDTVNWYLGRLTNATVTSTTP